jgi:hypothetical protein
MLGIRLKEQPIYKLGGSKETEILRKESCICAERIATDLLGNPNKKLSNGKRVKVR